MPISLTYDPATNRWTLTYGEWSYTFRAQGYGGSLRSDMRDEMAALGVELPDAAIAIMDLMGV